MSHVHTVLVNKRSHSGGQWETRQTKGQEEWKRLGGGFHRPRRQLLLLLLFETETVLTGKLGRSWGMRWSQQRRSHITH